MKYDNVVSLKKPEREALRWLLTAVLSTSQWPSNLDLPANEAELRVLLDRALDKIKLG